MILATSWDDGHPADERLATLLDKHGLAGTFFVPVRNCEGVPVLSTDGLRRLADHFEIGGHTLDHVCLTTVDSTEASHQIRDGKDELEQLLGRSVEGFCYPAGKVSPTVRRLVQQAGFRYGRTVENFRIDAGADPYQLPTTLQCYPHARRTLASNYLRHGRLAQRWVAFHTGYFAASWVERVRRLTDALADSDAVFHLWGHSWEIEEMSLWRELDSLFAHLARLHPQALDVRALAGTLRRSAN